METQQTNLQNERPWWMRWCMLFVLCVVIFSFVYCYDNPNAIQNQLIDDYGLTQIQYQLLYSLYNWVSCVGPLVAGFMIDCIGINTSTLIFYILIVVGHSLWIVACFKSVSSYPLMLVGRAIFAAGAEQFHTSRKWLLFDYFSGMEYYLSSGLSLSASRLGSATQSYVSAAMYNKHGIVGALSVGWVLVVLSLILIIVVLWLLRGYNHRDPHALRTSLSQIDQMEHLKAAPAAHGQEPQQHQSWKSWEPTFNLKGLCSAQGMDRRWWFLGLVLITFYSTYLSYSNVGSAFLQNRYQFSYEKGNSYAPIIFWIAAVFTPIFGFLCDYCGKRCIFMLASALSLLLGHLFLGFIGDVDSSVAVPVTGLVLLGFGYALGAAAVWPSFGRIVQQRYLALTLGIWACIDNCFQAVCNVIVGALSKNYTPAERAMYTDQFDDARYFWIALAICTLLSVLLLWYADQVQLDKKLWFPEEMFRRDEAREGGEMKNEKVGMQPIPTVDVDEDVDQLQGIVEVDVHGEGAEKTQAAEELLDTAVYQ